MVVDDQPANLKLLEGLLRSRGYQVRSFPRGKHALTAARQNPPDLILLDVNMPEMNGYEVCLQLKADARLKEVPVIFLSALNEVGDKLQAFQSGAVDYISKPFQFEEVQARVDAHSQLHRLRQALRRHNDGLEALVADRSQELAAAHARLKVLDHAKADFLQLVSHELRTPLNGLMGVGELLLEGSSADAELRDMFEQSRHRILTMIEDASVLLQIDLEDEFVSERVALASVLDRATAQAAAYGRPRDVTLERPSNMPGFVCGVEGLLIKALQCLLETAVRFANSGSAVRLASGESEGSIDLVIQSLGRTIPESLIPRFFDLLSIGEAVSADGDFGLGPAVASRILSLFDGSVAVQNRDPSGIQLKVSLRSAGSVESRESS